MRIISGNYRGRKLSFPQTEKIRPTADIVKQAMFTKLFDKVEGSVFLDLFCGSGQMGIEALSRGAREVVFVDIDVYALKTTHKNLQNIGANAIVNKVDFAVFLKKTDRVFDIVFVDPPFKKQDIYNQVLQMLYERKLLSKNGVIVCEHDKKLEIKQESFLLISTKNYGTKSLSYFQWKEQ